jgi:hypothetical protein
MMCAATSAWPTAADLAALMLSTYDEEARLSARRELLLMYESLSFMNSILPFESSSNAWRNEKVQSPSWWNATTKTLAGIHKSRQAKTSMD